MIILNPHLQSLIDGTSNPNDSSTSLQEPTLDPSSTSRHTESHRREQYDNDDDDDITRTNNGNKINKIVEVNNGTIPMSPFHRNNNNNNKGNNNNVDDDYNDKNCKRLLYNDRSTIHHPPPHDNTKTSPFCYNYFYILYLIISVSFGYLLGSFLPILPNYEYFYYNYSLRAVQHNNYNSIHNNNMNKSMAIQQDGVNITRILLQTLFFITVLLLFISILIRNLLKNSRRSYYKKHENSNDYRDVSPSSSQRLIHPLLPTVRDLIHELQYILGSVHTTPILPLPHLPTATTITTGVSGSSIYTSNHNINPCTYNLLKSFTVTYSSFLKLVDEGIQYIRLATTINLGLNSSSLALQYIDGTTTTNNNINMVNSFHRYQTQKCHFHSIVSSTTKWMLLQSILKQLNRLRSILLYHYKLWKSIVEYHPSQQEYQECYGCQDEINRLENTLEYIQLILDPFHDLILNENGTTFAPSSQQEKTLITLSFLTKYRQDLGNIVSKSISHLITFLLSDMDSKRDKMLTINQNNENLKDHYIMSHKKNNDYSLLFNQETEQRFIQMIHSCNEDSSFINGWFGFSNMNNNDYDTFCARSKDVDCQEEQIISLEAKMKETKQHNHNLLTEKSRSNTNSNCMKEINQMKIYLNSMNVSLWALEKLSSNSGSEDKTHNIHSNPGEYQAVHENKITVDHNNKHHDIPNEKRQWFAHFQRNLENVLDMNSILQQYFVHDVSNDDDLSKGENDDYDVNTFNLANDNLNSKHQEYVENQTETSSDTIIGSSKLQEQNNTLIYMGKGILQSGRTIHSKQNVNSNNKLHYGSEQLLLLKFYESSAGRSILLRELQSRLSVLELPMECDALDPCNREVIQDERLNDIVDNSNETISEDGLKNKIIHSIDEDTNHCRDYKEKLMKEKSNSELDSTYVLVGLSQPLLSELKQSISSNMHPSYSGNQSALCDLDSFDTECGKII